MLQQVFEKLFNLYPDGCMLLDRNGLVVHSNSVGSSLLGYQKNEIIGLHFSEFIEETTGRFLLRMEPSDTFSASTMIGKGGQRVEVDVFTKTAEVESEIIAVIFRERAIKHCKRQVEWEQCHVYQAIIDDFPHLFWHSGPDGEGSLFNQAWLEFTGCGLNEEKGQGWTKGIHEDDRQLLASNYLQALSKRCSFEAEFRLRRRDGVYRWMRSASRPFFDSDGLFQGFFNSCTDVTNSKRQEEILKQQQHQDSLTALYNRSFFNQALEMTDIATCLPTSIVVVDVNGLKLCNDALGHEEGDALLTQVAQVLRSSCRCDDVIARLGGDEFAILLPHTDNKTATTVCERILKAATQIGKAPMPISVALGCATMESPTEDLQQTLQLAEKRMYQHKLLSGHTSHTTLISSLQRTLREKSHETEEHANRIKRLSCSLGEEIGLSKDELNELAIAALLHDIGKVVVSDTVLQKKASLTGSETKEMHRHPEVGYRLIRSFPEIASVAHVVLSHHERWDGQGYPRGLQGTDIPLLARVISIADAFDAMTNTRPYRKTLSTEEALGELQRCAGTQFDAELVARFVSIIQEQALDYIAQG